MPGETFRGRSRTASVLINRAGTPVDILRPDSPPENKYGKVSDSDVTYSQVASSVCRRIYPTDDERPREARTIGGRIDTEEPRLAFPKNTNVQEGDRVQFQDDGKQYQIDEHIPRETHDEYRATLVQ